MAKLTPRENGADYDIVTASGTIAGRAERRMWGAKPYWCVMGYPSATSAAPTHPIGNASSLAKACEVLRRDHVTKARLSASESAAVPP